ncbi:FAD binding domain-containing protein [Fusarium flagelliforme]|uniref:FAD binding domain-containing protein n=1 Tax=Fusarium flagelliforme TaxID=2675880 RepID=UPI001E8E1A45|nr:FAD binding domain-containing protein [Fusarium flagelliforme]KAH7188051.1 FAD binding domain-containing protein [Fusarium flagelliforme]
MKRSQTYISSTKVDIPPRILLVKLCDASIQANLSHLGRLANSPLYPTLGNGSWVPDTRKSPFCFVLPTTAEEVSQTIVALRDAGNGGGDWHIAVRSGGHGTDHLNNIDTGVTIDLTQINASTYNKETNIASVGTGARWGDVYADLLEHDVSVMGGREGVVGVGGVVLGGGVSWYTSKRAFACDSVVNYEVVLANGSIIHANRHSHGDLWKALKGGGANFGIVTRFDMEAFPAQNITKATTMISMEHLDEALKAVVGFTNLDQSFEDNYLLTAFNYDQASDSTVITLTEVNTANNLNSSAFDSVRKIPTLRQIPAKAMSLAESAHGSSLSDEMRTIGAGPITVANDPRILRFIVDKYNGFVKDIKQKVNPSNFSTIFDLQPLPSRVADYSVSKGGNMLGLERNNRDRVIAAVGAILFGGQYSDQDVALIYQLSVALNEKIIAHAKSLGLSEDWVYLAYADAQQDPQGSYGQANTHHIRQVSQKYDADGFFQKRVPGGFKIDRVDTGMK